MKHSFLVFELFWFWGNKCCERGGADDAATAASTTEEDRLTRYAFALFWINNFTFSVSFTKYLVSGSRCEWSMSIMLCFRTLWCFVNTRIASQLFKKQTSVLGYLRRYPVTFLVNIWMTSPGSTTCTRLLLRARGSKLHWAVHADGFLRHISFVQVCGDGVQGKTCTVLYLYSLVQIND